MHLNISRLILISIVMTGVVLGAPVKTKMSQAVPCAYIENFGGTVQILDASRVHVEDAAKQATVACGAWVSVEAGWAVVNHREGHKIFLGKNTFLGANIQEEKAADQFTLLRGKIFLETDAGNPELAIVTSNARARMTKGKGMMIYADMEEKTQVVSIKEKITLENRFVGSRRVQVVPGESTSLNFGKMRVIPSTPRVLSRAQLQPVMGELHLNKRQRKLILSAVSKRAERKFATPYHKEKTPARTIASEASYSRHLEVPGDTIARKEWVKNLVGGAKEGERILFPDKHHGPPQKGQVIVIDPSAAFERRESTREDKEKQRLMEKLREIHVN